MTPTEWLKANATLKDTAKIEEFNTLVTDLDPLANIKTKEDALNFVDRNNLFKSGLDSAISKAVASHDEKYAIEKLPDLLKAEREKAIKEANPEETAEQKANREMREEMQSLKSELSNEKQLKAILSKAKELDYKGDASRYLAYGDKALEMLESDQLQNKAYLDAEKDRLQKEVYGKNTPPVKGEVILPKDIDEQIRTARSEGNASLALNLQMQKNTKPQQD